MKQTQMLHKTKD